MARNTTAAAILLDHHAEINDDDVSGRYSLLLQVLSALRKMSKSSKSLLIFLIVISAQDRGRTALHIAAFQGDLNTVKLLVDRGSSLSKREKSGRTPFFLACSNGHLETARFLMSALQDQGDSDINEAMNDGRTPLSKAAGRGHLGIVKILLETIDVSCVNFRETELNSTALRRAAHNGRIEVVELLLQAGADALDQDKDGKTPLALCGQGWAKDKSGNWGPVIENLIDHDHETARTESDLIFTATIKGSTQAIEKLLGAGAPPNQQDEHGWTPLQLAREYGNIDTAKFLSQRGAEVGSKPSAWVNEIKKLQMSEDGNELKCVGDGGWVPYHALRHYTD